MNKSNLSVFIEWLEHHDKNNNVIFKLDSDAKTKIVSDYYKLLIRKKEDDKRKDALDVLSEIGLKFFKTKNNLIKIRYSEKDLIEHLYFLYNEIIDIKIKELKGVKK